MFSLTRTLRPAWLALRLTWIPEIEGVDGWHVTRAVRKMREMMLSASRTILRRFEGFRASYNSSSSAKRGSVDMDFSRAEIGEGKEDAEGNNVFTSVTQVEYSCGVEGVTMRIGTAGCTVPR